MTRKERIERRLANRTKRQERKTLRKEKFDELMVRVKDTPGFPEDGSTPDYVQKFKTYWPPVKAALMFAESTRITRPKMDLQIQRIILLGDGMADNSVFDPDSEFIIKAQNAWRTVRTILISITAITKSDTNDDKTDKLIEIGDWITGLEGND